MITLRSCRPIVHRLRYLAAATCHWWEAAVNTGASQPSSTASADNLTTPASSLWDKLNAAKSSDDVCYKRLFSKAGNVITKKRYCLASAKAYSVVFCYKPNIIVYALVQ